MKLKLQVQFNNKNVEATDIEKLVKETMESAIELSVPLVADESVGQTWYEAK